MAAPTKGRDAKTIGLPAAAGGGVLIGALVGGKKGAAIGAGIGACAGTAAVLATPGKPVVWPEGTRLAFAVGRDIDARVPLAPQGN